jgi:hypothetical protein
MALFRQYVAPFLIVLVFLVALVAVSSRIFLPADMAAPAPISDVVSAKPEASGKLAGLPPALSALVKGLPDDPAEQFQSSFPLQVSRILHGAANWLPAAGGFTDRTRLAPQVHAANL